MAGLQPTGLELFMVFTWLQGLLKNVNHMWLCTPTATRESCSWNNAGVSASHAVTTSVVSWLIPKMGPMYLILAVMVQVCVSLSLCGVCMSVYVWRVCIVFMHASGWCGYGGVGETCARVGLSRCKSLYCKGGLCVCYSIARNFERKVCKSFKIRSFAKKKKTSGIRYDAWKR